MSFHQIDDETLLAYAEDRLDPARRAEVAALLEQAPELAAELDALKRLQRGLRSTFDAADLLPTPGAASWERITRRTARRRWQRLGVALGAGVCVLAVLMFAALVLGYGGQSGTMAAPTMTGAAYPAPTFGGAPPSTNTPGWPAPTDGSYLLLAPSAEAQIEPAHEATPTPTEPPTTVPLWPNVAIVSGTLPIGRMVFTASLGEFDRLWDPCRIWRARNLTPTPEVYPPPVLEGYTELEEKARIFVLSAGDQWPTHIANGCFPTLSPDGKRLAYSRDGDIFVINADGSQETRVTNDPAHESFPSWSPDGQRIAFSRERFDSTSYLYVMSADGTGQTQLTTDAIYFVPEIGFNWSPNGQQIVFSDGRSINVINADGSQQIGLTSDSQRSYWPMWSPDGKKIAFVSERSECCGPYTDIYLMNADGSEQTQLTTDGGLPVWSPDGSRIAFASGFSGRGGRSDVFMMNADGRQQTGLVTIEADGWLVWSPDGQYIAFRTSQGGESSIAVLKLDGSQLIRLPIQTYGDLSWSR